MEFAAVAAGHFHMPVGYFEALHDDDTLSLEPFQQPPYAGGTRTLGVVMGMIPVEIRSRIEEVGGRPRTQAAVGAAVSLLLIAGLVAVNPTPDTDVAGRGAEQQDLTAPASGELAGDAAAPDGAEGLGAPLETAEGRTEHSGAGISSSQPGGGAAGTGAPSGSPVAPAAAACTFSGCEGKQGVTGDAIKLGFLVSEGVDKAFAAFGVSTNYGDFKNQIRILVDDLNKRGGAAGRKVVPVYVENPVPGTSSNPDGDAKRACVQFTEDAQVFAVIPDGLQAQPMIRSCLAQRRTLSISGMGRVTDDAAIAQDAPWAQLHNSKSITRQTRTLVPALVRSGYFGKWSPDLGPARNAKVGLIVYDDPGYIRASDSVMKPLLAKAGIELGDEFRMPFADYSQIPTYMSQAVLRFKEKGVTHVMFLPGAEAFFFYQNAERQGFRPRYAVDSYTFPGLMAQSAPDQARGAMGISHLATDVPPARGNPLTVQEKRCLELMQKNGEDAQDRGSGAVAWCDMVWLFEEAANRAGRNLTSGAFVGALRSLGTWDYNGFPADFTRGTADGSYSHRILAFDDGCKCFLHKSGLLPDE